MPWVFITLFILSFSIFFNAGATMAQTKGATSSNYIFSKESSAQSVYDFLSGQSPDSKKITRKRYRDNSFAQYVQELPLKKNNDGIFDASGKKLYGAEYAMAIIDIDVWRFQECADIAMRLWGEYLFANDAIGKLRLKLENNTVNNMAITDRSSFEKYFQHQFLYAGSYSLLRDLKTIELKNVLPGDLIVQRKPKSVIGHVYVIVDVAYGKQQQTYVALAESYIPAQSFHLLSNDPIPYVGWQKYKDEFTAQKKGANNAWFDLDKFLKHTKQTQYGQGVLKRFVELKK